WKNNKINQGSVKILWGVFTLILLGLIASFIFGLIALHYYKEANRKPQYSNNNNYYQDPNNMYPNPNIPNNNLNKYDNIQKIYDLYKNGAITEEEYLKMKKDLLDN
ncbi:MAG: SHOCT domain-containing protein, partial [Candidatus Ureaplasma intestinipullorum]|nr:SHOCT domain-containing protein [Candidatus Ureaplasma intestinipullorum]